jgi:pimeloyl-ACP methyl ester carboxylesterase
VAVLERIRSFSAQYGRQLNVAGRAWCYYRLGSGTPVLWLTGGLRRAALGFEFMQLLATRHTVIAPDYPPVKTIGEFLAAFDCILRAEEVGCFTLAGQSYGGMLAQAYLAARPAVVDRLILSSSGPADFGSAWLPAEYACIALANILSEKFVKELLTGRMLDLIAFPSAERLEWEFAISMVLKDELTREDVVSHFAVAADLIRKRILSPGSFAGWTGSVAVLSAHNDPTQSKSDASRYERLFGRPVQFVDMGEMGHAAGLSSPRQYVTLLESVLG